jgi:hypothetical protein
MNASCHTQYGSFIIRYLTEPHLKLHIISSWRYTCLRMCTVFSFLGASNFSLNVCRSYVEKCKRKKENELTCFNSKQLINLFVVYLVQFRVL